MEKKYILAIESSCDETSAAVVVNGREVLSNIIASQIDTHKKFGGVVPEVASRMHIEVVSGVVQEALEEAGRKRGHQIKLETQGAMGAENEITEDDLKTADIVLIAVGCAVEGLERFDGKCVVEIDVADAIKNPEAAIVKLEKAV